MLVLFFNAGSNRYAIEAGLVLEVLPWVDLRPLPHTPPTVAGTFNYHGATVPVLDLVALLVGACSRPVLSSRILLVDFVDAAGGRHPLGLLAEKVTDTGTFAVDEAQPAGVAPPDAPYLGPLLVQGREQAQLIRVAELLPDDLRQMLFQPEA